MSHFDWTTDWQAALLANLVTVGLLLATLPWLDPSDTRLRRAFFWAYFGLKALYFVWRVDATMPGWSLRPSVLYAYVFLGFELLVTVASYRFFGLLTVTHSRHAEADAHADWWGDAAPPVAILIPTYNEPLAILERTVIGALNQSYANCTVWVLDDGRRGELQAACKAWGVHYVCRRDNLHAKAGNLNSGLRALQAAGDPAQFISVLDADFVPRREFIRRAMSLMYAPERAIVQTPQSHLNADPFQTRFKAWAGWPDMQRFSFNTILPACDGRGFAYCCGTSFIVRRSGLDAIGGFPTEAVTEDVLTSTKLAKAGYSTVYLEETLTTGLAPEGVREYLTQRGRWCLGGVQVGLWKLSQLSGLSLVARFLTLEGALRWGYTSLSRLFFLCTPIVYFMTDVSPFLGNTWDILLYAVPAQLLLRGFMTWMSRGAQLPIVFEAGSVLASITVVRAMFKALLDRRSHRFVVTDKGANSERTVVHWGTLKWGIAYVVLLVGGAYHAVAQGWGVDLTSFFGITLMWGFFNLCVVLVAMAPCIEAPRRRGEERCATDETVKLHDSSSLRAVDISTDGALLEIDRERLGSFRVGTRLTLRISRVGEVEAEVVRTALRRGRSFLGVRFETQPATRAALIRKIFSGADYVHPPTEGSVAAAARAIVTAVFA
ncbi:MAG TPA: glycosyltransferase [Polyangiaceae bacterium]|nr:glycosyltransferase [Polyangiaceae bacterium]